MSSKTKTRSDRSWPVSLSLAVAVLLLVSLSGGESQAQNPPFNSGSTGHEGALNVTAPGVTYFDPVAMNLNPVVPGIFNFTTINVASGSTLKFTENKYHGAVYLLASGDVTISGTLDLTGDNSYGVVTCSPQPSGRFPNAAGSGGFSGGIGGCGTNYPALPGNGPGGGAAGTNVQSAVGGTNTSNVLLVPLIGGSGGGGNITSAIGSAGGGAILIASSTTIAINSPGFINANGGSSGCNFGNAGGGAGGAVRLVATTIQGNGTVSVKGFSSCNNASNSSGDGVVRFESNNLGVPNTVNGPWTKSLPELLNVQLIPTPSIKVTSINGQPINSNPFAFPDIAINAPLSVPVTIQAQYVPVGTIARMYIFSEGAPDQVIAIGPLTGSDQTLTTATANITYPPGGSRGYVKATW